MDRIIFTSGYISGDYEYLRDRLSKKFSLSEPLKGIGGKDLPIIQGSSVLIAPGCEWVDLCKELEGVKTSCCVRFIVISTITPFSNVYIIDKDQSGNVEYHEIFESYVKLQEYDKHKLDNLNYKIDE